MSDYKPGTVAVATVRGVEGVRVMRGGGPGVSGRDQVPFWITGTYLPGADQDGFRIHRDHDVTDVRPLVVLDPEDREAVRRLLETYGRQFTAWTPELDSNVTKLQAALREFANPRPQEPGKYGAIIAGDGREWFRYTTSEKNGYDWCRPAADGGTQYAAWGDLDVIRVTNEGVAQ